MNFIGAILNHPVVIEFLAEIVVKFEVKPYERKRKRQRERDRERQRDRERGIHIKSNCQDFPKPGILLRSSECLKLLRRNHYKNI